MGHAAELRPLMRTFVHQGLAAAALGVVACTALVAGLGGGGPAVLVGRVGAARQQQLSVREVMRRMDSEGRADELSQSSIAERAHSVSLGIGDYESLAGAQKHRRAALGGAQKAVRLAQAHPQSLADRVAGETPAPDATKYEEEKFGQAPNEIEAGVPADFAEAMADCKGSRNCMSLQTKPVRGTASERMPLYRLSPNNKSPPYKSRNIPDCFPYQPGVPCY